MTRSIRFTLAALALAPTLAACGAGRGAPSTRADGGEVELRDDEILVRVTNTYHGIVDVYAVGRGLVDRLGTVGVGTPATFRVRLNQFPPSSQVQIVARPLGGGGRNASSGALTLRGGEVIEFNVNGSLFGSVLIR